MSLTVLVTRFICQYMALYVQENLEISLSKENHNTYDEKDGEE